MAAEGFRAVLARAEPLPGGQFLPGAHHPHCERHHHHLVRVFGRPLCLGCTCLYSGMILGASASLALPWSALSPPAWLLACSLLVLPTALQPWVQRRGFKLFARTALGVGVALYWVGLLGRLELPIDRLAAIAWGTAWFAACVAALMKVRLRRMDDPCSRCPLGRYPTCEWYLPTLLADPRSTNFRQQWEQRLPDPS